MKKTILVLPFSAFLLLGCNKGHNWKEVDYDKAKEIIHKISTDYEMPEFYSAKDKEGDVTFGFDDSQMFLGQTNPITGNKLYYVVGEDEKLYRLTYVKESTPPYSKIMVEESDVRGHWDNEKKGYLFHEDFAYTLFNFDGTLEIYMSKVEEVRSKHSDNPDEWAYCRFKSYNDSSIQCEMMIKEDANNNVEEYVIAFENNRPSFVSQKFVTNEGTKEDKLTYDYKSKVTIPEEANPQTWPTDD